MKKLSYIALVLILAMCSACAQKSQLVYVIDKAAIDESMLEEYGAFIDLEDFAAQSRSELRKEALMEFGWLVSDLKVARKKDGYEFTMVFDEPLYSIPDEFFDGADGLTSVRIPNTVKKIGDRAFADCESLVSVVIPNSVTEIGYDAFDGCTSLRKFKGAYASADGVCLIDNGYLFCVALAGLPSEYKIPSSVTKIGDDVFWNCKTLHSVTIPDSVTKIGVSAFANCKALHSVTIPNSVTEIGHSAFFGCEALASVVIPDSVTAIASDAFGDCKTLRAVTIPNSVTEIGYGAFSYCESLTSVVIPDSVTEIGPYAFANCHALESVSLPQGVRLDYGAFPRHTRIEYR